jgi:hypothetical protein
MNIKEKIEKILSADSLLMQSLEEIKASKPNFKDLFSGTFADKLRVLVKGLATFAVIFRDKYCAQEGITVEQLIAELSDYLDKKVELPWYAEYFDGPVFTWLISYGMNYVKSAAESKITVAYQQAFDAAEAGVGAA